MLLMTAMTFLVMAVSSGISSTTKRSSDVSVQLGDRRRTPGAQATGTENVRQVDPNGPSRHNVVKRSVRKVGSVGGSRMMECDIVYPGGRYMERIITWRKHGIEVPVFVQFNGYPPHVDQSYQGRIRLVEQASIEITDLRPRDQGWYECSVVFLDGATEESSGNGTWIYLSVNSPPVLRNSINADEDAPHIGQLLVRRRGDSVTLNCDVVAGIPAPTIAWTKDDADLAACEITELADGGGEGGRVAQGGKVEDVQRWIVDGTQLIISDLRPSDGGRYRCIAKNVVGQDEEDFRLVIEGSVYIMAGPKNVTAFEGSQARLSCHADGYPGNVTYRWFHLGLLSPSHRKQEQYSQHSSVWNSDNDDEDEDIGDDDDLDVEELRTEWSQMVPRLTKQFHQQLQLKPRLRFQVLDDGSLFINNVTSADLGWYSCQPIIELGESRPTNTDDESGATTPEARAFLNVTC